MKKCRYNTHLQGRFCLSLLSTIFPDISVVRLAGLVGTDDTKSNRIDDKRKMKVAVDKLPSFLEIIFDPGLAFFYSLIRKFLRTLRLLSTLIYWTKADNSISLVIAIWIGVFHQSRLISISTKNQWFLREAEILFVYNQRFMKN